MLYGMSFTYLRQIAILNRKNSVKIEVHMKRRLTMYILYNRLITALNEKNRILQNFILPNDDLEFMGASKNVDQ